MKNPVKNQKSALHLKKQVILKYVSAQNNAIANNKISISGKPMTTTLLTIGV